MYDSHACKHFYVEYVWDTMQHLFGKFNQGRALIVECLLLADLRHLRLLTLLDSFRPKAVIHRIEKPPEGGFLQS